MYKENLVETILPSIQSVMTAVLHYKKMGGEANLYINDDGLQVCLLRLVQMCVFCPYI